MHAIGPSGGPLPCKGNEMASQQSQMKGFEQVAEARSESQKSGIMRMSKKGYLILPVVVEVVEHD